MLRCDDLVTTWTRLAGELPLRWPLAALVVGDTTRVEFRDAVAHIRQHIEAVYVNSLDEALAAVGLCPDLIVLLAARPGEYAAAKVDQLRRAAPLARVISLLGSWCEGESRSGTLLAGVTRVYWHGWPTWFEREIETLARGNSGELSLAVTASEEERLLWIAETFQNGAPGETIATSSARREMASLLADACRAFGYRTVELQPDGAPSTANPAAGVWDQASLADDDFAGLRDLVCRYPGIPWIALTTFPREPDRARALASGACEVVSKPLVLDDLCAALERALARR
jgi:hypothetical protein